MTAPTLYIVATPIGNLSDLSKRAQEILAQVDFILNHFDIKNNVDSLHLHNEKEKVKFLIEKLIQSKNQSAALVSDAGTPAICDPGAYLVSEAHAQQVKVVSVPGPCSMTCALSASGFIQPRTLFSGFLSKSKNEQAQEFSVWVKASPCVAVFFESPRRVADTLQNWQEFLSARFAHVDLNLVEICLSREISKKFEEHRRMFLPNAIKFYQEQSETLGEFVVCVNLNKTEEIKEKITIEFAAREAVLMSNLYNLPLKSCCKQLAEKYSFSAKEIYAMSVTLFAGIATT